MVLQLSEQDITVINKAPVKSGILIYCNIMVKYDFRPDMAVHIL